MRLLHTLELPKKRHAWRGSERSLKLCEMSIYWTSLVGRCSESLYCLTYHRGCMGHLLDTNGAGVDLRRFLSSWLDVAMKDSCVFVSHVHRLSPTDLLHRRVFSLRRLFVALQIDHRNTNLVRSLRTQNRTMVCTGLDRALGYIHRCKAAESAVPPGPFYGAPSICRLECASD